MSRNPKTEEKVEQPKEAEPQVQIMEREINLSLLNDKLNYVTSLLHKIAEATKTKLD